MLSEWLGIYFGNMGKESQIETIALFYDLVDDDQPTKAQIARFYLIAQELVDNAESKLD